MKNLLNYMGVDQDRVNFTWVSASEGARFAEVITDLTGKVKEMGPNTGLFRKAE